MCFMYQHVPIWILYAIAVSSLNYTEKQPFTATDVQELWEHHRLQENKAKVYRTRSVFGILLTKGIPHFIIPYLHFIVPCS